MVDKRRNGNSARILAQLANGQLTAQQLSGVLDLPVTRIYSLLGWLQNSGGVVSVPHGRWPKTYRLHMGAAEPPPPPPPTRPDPDLDDDAALRRPRSRSGSGVIAGRLVIRGYRF